MTPNPIQNLPSFLLAAMVALAIALSASATPPETPPPGMAKYMMVVWEAGTPLPGKERKLAPREVPDVVKLGGRVLMSNENRYVIYLPKGEAKGLRHHPAVMYLQRIWTGESFDDWDEADAPENHSRARIGSDSDPDLNWGPVNYTYDGSGNVKTAGGDAYTYDSAGRLIQATVGGKTETYKYDSFGNLIEKAVAGSAAVSIPVDGGSNRMIGPEYDAAGNVVRTPAGNWYTYDSAGMMATVSHLTQRRNIYDADDERIGRTFGTMKSRWTIRDLEGRVLREFVSDHPAEPWVWEQDHVYAGGMLVAGETQEWGHTATYRYGGRRHYHLDHLGSVRMVTNDDSRRAVAQRDYYPFGVEQTPSWQEPLDGNNFIDDARFTGHERDFLGLVNVEGSDYLDYMHARFYDPNKGRFLSVDPLMSSADPRFPQSWNRYTYALNNPLKYIDPTGENATVVCDPDNNCTATVEAQIVADPNDPAQMAAATDFRNGAVNYWQERQEPGTNGENITFQVNISIVAPGQTVDGVDTLTVVSGSGRSNVQMSVFHGGGESPFDTGTIFTSDSTNNPAGMAGVAPHETGHLFGLRDMYEQGGTVSSWDSSPTENIMKYGQPTNGVQTAFWVLSPSNGNSVVYRQQGPPRRCATGPCS